MHCVKNWEMQRCLKQRFSLHCHLCPEDSKSLGGLLWFHHFISQLPWNLIDKKDSGSRKCTHGLVCHIANSGVVDKSPEKQQESDNQENPPKPVLPIKISREVCRKPDNQDPFNQGQSETRYSPVSASSRGRQTERQEEANPVKQECHEERQHKYPIISHSQLVCIIKAISGNKVLIPVSDQGNGGLGFVPLSLVVWW